MADKKIEKPDTAGMDNKAKAQSSRRGFIKKAVLAGIAVTATAGLAKKTSDVLLKEDFQKLYMNDVLPGDKELASRQYVLMTRGEKEALVKTLIENHKDKA